MKTARALLPILALFALSCSGSDGVVDKYEDEVAEAQAEAPRELSEQLQLDARMLGDVLREVDAIEATMRELNETYLVSENQNTGLYTVEQERHIAAVYSRYLTLRKALFHVAFRNKDYAEIDPADGGDEAFLLAYASGLSLYRNAVLFVVLFRDQPNARRKLNEADPVQGIPAGVFDEMYANITDADNVALVLQGLAEFEARRERLEASPLLETPGMEDILTRLDDHEAQLTEAYTMLADGKRDVLWTKLKTGVADPAYEGQTFVSVLVSHVRTPLHAPGLTPESAQEHLAPLLQPGDILLTRRDGYLTNTFLPGNWGHAALYLGTPDELRALGDDPALEDALAKFQGVDHEHQLPFTAIEAIGEGVRRSSLPFALHANMIAVLRPKATDAQKQTAAIRAIELLGTPYDFAFDLSSQDKIICTELVYRVYAPLLDVSFEDVMGTKTLKPDGMLRELAPHTEDGLAEMVTFGRAVEGVFVAESIDAMMATVQ